MVLSNRTKDGKQAPAADSRRLVASFLTWIAVLPLIGGAVIALILGPAYGLGTLVVVFLVGAASAVTSLVSRTRRDAAAGRRSARRCSAG